MVHMYSLLHEVTYMTRIDYNALFTPLIAKACVVQWIECRPPVLGADGSNHGDGRYFFIYRKVYRIFSDFYLYSRSAFFMCTFYLVR